MQNTESNMIVLINDLNNLTLPHFNMKCGTDHRCMYIACVWTQVISDNSQYTYIRQHKRPNPLVHIENTNAYMYKISLKLQLWSLSLILQDKFIFIIIPCLDQFMKFMRYSVIKLSEVGQIQINGLVQERHNSIALAMELRLSCTNPSTWCNGTCHLGCQYWDYYSGTLSLSQATAIHLKIRVTLQMNL